MSKRRSGITADINVTPLVDVVLVLLIIFMVVTPQMESGPEVKLPAASSGKSAKAEEETPLTLTVTAAGEVYLEKEKSERDALDAALRKLRVEQPERKVVVKGDAQARYADVRALFRTCQTLGFPGVGLQVEQKGKH